MSLLYSAQDMAKIACNNCEGCHACCEKMGDTVVLTPLDVYRLTKHLGQSFEELLNQKIALHMEEGMILPHLMMAGEAQQCVFLNQQGRCSIHEFRPGICRLFPLGRNYKDASFQYFVVEGACPKPGKSKVKISKWLQEEDLKQQENFINTWHYFTNDVKEALRTMEDANQARTVNMFLLQEFYQKPYDATEEFYPQFEARYARIRQAIMG